MNTGETRLAEPNSNHAPIDVPESKTEPILPLVALASKVGEALDPFDDADASALAGQLLLQAAQGLRVEWFADFAARIEAREEKQGPALPGELRDAFIFEARAALKADMRRKVFDLDRGTEDWASNTHAIEVAWGTTDKALAYSDGRPLLVFGNAGATKTLTLLRYLAGLLGIPGYETLLGWPVEAIDPDAAVVLFALDGPNETQASASRLIGPDGRNIAEWAGSRLIIRSSLPFGPSHSDEEAVAEYLRQLEEREERHIAVVGIDNLIKMYGDVSQTNRGAFAGASLAAIEADGRGIAATTQVKKNSKPRTEDDALLAQAALNGMGTILSVHKTQEGTRDGTRPTKVELRHHKGAGSDSSEAHAVTIDLPSGVMCREAEGPSEELLAHVARLPQNGTFTRANAEKIWQLGRSQAQREIDDLDAHGLVELDHVGPRGTKYWRVAK